MGDLIGTMIIAVIMLGIGLMVGAEMGRNEGRLQVATKAWECQQLPDQRWECYKVKL